MRPEDRVETVAKTKAGAQREKASSGSEDAPCARHTVLCDDEGANLLTVNLMHDIVTGRRTVEKAREDLGEQQVAWHRAAPYRGQPVMKGPTVRRTVETVKDVLTGRDG